MRRLLVALGVTVLLFVAVDRGAKYLVEKTLADHVETTEGVSDADVSIGGFPFLTQVAENHFDEIDVSMPHVSASLPAGSLEVQDVQVALRDVETSHRFTRATAASATGSGLVPYAAFDQFAPVQVEFGGATPDGTGYLTVSAPSLGPRTVNVVPSAVDGLTLSLDSLSILSRALPTGLRSFVGGAHDFAGLPRGLRIERLDAAEDGLRVTLVGSDIAIAQ
jgi:hypothetical protein